MADKDLTIEEILARSRELDGQGEASAPAPAAEEAPAAEAAPAPASVDPSKMSVEDMLAAARASASGESDATAEQAEVPVESPAAADPSKMSVADMLAAARASATDDSGASADAPPAKAAASAAPAEKTESAAPAGPPDTASILAAARKGVQRGPQSVEEAVKTVEEEGGKPAAKAAVKVPPAPRKEDFLPPKPAPVAEVSSRRGFFASTLGVLFGAPLAVGFTSMAVTSLLWVLGLARFMFPNVLTEPPTKFKVGFPDTYGPGQVEAKYKAQFGVWVVRFEYEGEAQIFALKSVCTHLGCTPNWLEGEQKFKCPCHGSGFYKDGINFEGPAPRPLERYAIRLADDGQLEVDKSTKFNEELGQWADPNSFVSV